MHSIIFELAVTNYLMCGRREVLWCVTPKSWVSPELPNKLYMLIVTKLKVAIKADREGINLNDIDTGRERLKVSVFFMQHHTMKAWPSGDISPCIITSALNWCDRSSSCYTHCTPTQSLQNPVNRKLGGLALEFVWMLGRIEEPLNDTWNQSMIRCFLPIW